MTVGTENFKRMDREEFERQYEKLDTNADHVISRVELKKQGLDQVDQAKHLAIGIVWIGYTLDPNY